MLKSLYSGVSGLQTHQKKMDVIGNNIANVNTTAYKSQNMVFSDLLYQTTQAASGANAATGRGGINPRQVGYGVKMNSATPNLSNNGYASTDDKYSMALDGNGFFQVMDSAGNIRYTRAGVFHVDDDGYLVNESGMHVLGISGESQGQAPDSQIIRLVVPDTNAKCSSATKKINGVNVTLSVSAPSDNTNMSVSFVNSEYPFATYANGILTVNMNMDKQYNSETDFQNAINDALNAGGVTLPDDVEIIFEFESIPNNPEAVAATNTVTWTYSTPNSTADIYAGYEYTSNSGATSTKYAQIAFATPEVPTTAQVELNYDPGAAVGTAPVVNYDGTNWQITINANTAIADVNKAINDFIDAQATANPDVEIPKLTCTTFVFPANYGTTDNRQAAYDALVAANGSNSMQLQGGKDVPIDVSFDVTEAGAYANDYKITFAYSSTYGEGKTKAVWDENNLTITINNSTTVAEIQAAIDEAAAGNDKKKLIMSGLDQLDGMNAGERKAMFEGNPSMSLGDGDDSFFTKCLKSLSTFNLTDGRYGSAQTWGNLSDVTIQQDGTIIGYHAVHGYMDLGRIDIATFDNPNGLSQIGGTMFAETVSSGSPILNIAGQGGAGNVLSGALEMSNVDLSQEFTDMITTQRGFQANSRTITVSDTLLEELLSLKR